MSISSPPSAITSARADRLVGLDMARALAFIGMVLVHFNLVMTVESAEPQWLVRTISLLEGRAVALFIVLAGVGLSLLSRRAVASHDPPQLAATRRTLWKRALFLFICGLLFSLAWPADILRYYGLYIAFAAFFVAASNRTLWLTAASLIIISPVLMLRFDYAADWDFATISYTSLDSLGGILRYFLFNGFHPIFPWGAFVLIGMWVGRQDMGSSVLRRRLFVVSVAVALSAETLSFFLTSITTGDLSYLFDTAPLPPAPLYIIASSATAIAVIMISLTLADRFANTLWFKALVACGQIVLTLYIAHVMVGMLFFEQIGKLYGQSIIFAVINALAFSLLAVLFALLWRNHFKRGPLETLMRYLT